MSLIISLQEQENIILRSSKIPNKFKNQLKQYLFKYQAINYIDFGYKLVYLFDPSPMIIYFPTKWTIDIQESGFKIIIQFLDRGQCTPLKVQGQRLKVQLGSFIRRINSYTLPQYRFLLDPFSGYLKFIFAINWFQYNSIFTRQQLLKRLIQKLIKHIQTYINQITYFALINHSEYKSNKKQRQLQDIYREINRYKYLLKNTIGARNYLNMAIDAKNNQKIDQLVIQNWMRLYLTHIKDLNQCQIGLEGQNKFYVNQQHFVKQYQSIQNNQVALSAIKCNKKIVSGLLSLNSQSQPLLLSKQGAHSQIYIQKFSYKVIQTINRKVWQQIQRSGNTIIKQPQVGFLVYKKCTSIKQSSINSFKNQLKVLQFLRSNQSKYIAQYFLQISNNPIQSKQIYMTVYKKNLYNFLKQSSTLSNKNRLILSYRICKGLCFLSFNTILHRDFKPHNVVVDNNLNPKIIDFGSAAPKYDSKQFMVHDLRLLSTDSFHITYDKLKDHIKNKYSRKQYQLHPLFDVYSLGRTLSYIFFQRLEPPIPQDNVSCEDPQDRPCLGEITSFLLSLNRLTNF